MPEYRIYTLGHLEQFIGVRSIECPDDNAAILAAKRMLDVHSLEVWQVGSLFISRLGLRTNSATRSRGTRLSKVLLMLPPLK